MELFQYRGIIVNLNDFRIGRMSSYKHSGHGPYLDMIVRRGAFMRKYYPYTNIPVSQIVRPIESYTPHPEGVMFIMPYQKDAPGYYYFKDLPMTQLANTRKELARVEKKLNAMIETKELSFDMMKEIYESIHEINRPAPKTLTTQPLAPKGRGMVLEE